MEIEHLDLPGLMLVTPRVFEDSRGRFSEVFNEREFQRRTGVDFRVVQVNRSDSVQINTIRGMHLQVPPEAQSKLLRVERGRILDCVVDIRRGSPTYLGSVVVELSDEDATQLFIPKGFLHGFRTMEPNTHVIYNVDAHYSPETERSVRFDDPDLDIDWQLVGGEALHLSDKDRDAKSFKDLEDVFEYQPVRM